MVNYHKLFFWCPDPRNFLPAYEYALSACWKPSSRSHEHFQRSMAQELGLNCWNCWSGWGSSGHCFPILTSSNQTWPSRLNLHDAAKPQIRVGLNLPAAVDDVFYLRLVFGASSRQAPGHP